MTSRSSCPTTVRRTAPRWSLSATWIVAYELARHERTMSASSHGNYLIHEAKGELFVGLSDDGWIEPDFCERAGIELYGRHPELRFVYSGAFIHYADVPVPSLLGPEIESGDDFLRACFAQEREVCWCASVCRTANLRAGPDS